MKLSDYCFLSILLPAALSAQPVQIPVDPNCCGNEPEGTVLQIRRAPSAEALHARRSAAAVNAYGSAGIQILEEKVEIKTEKASFLGGSEFLLGAKGFVIVPKGCAVTSSPRIKVLSEPPVGEKLQDWETFKRSNVAAFRELPISKEVLNGDEEAVKKIVQKVSGLKTGGFVYVTTLNGNPVSIPNLSTVKSS